MLPPLAPSSLARGWAASLVCLGQLLTRSSSSFPQQTCVLKRHNYSDQAKTVWWMVWLGGWYGLVDALRRPSHQSQSLIRPPDCKCQADTVQSGRSCSSAANRKGRKGLTVSSACLVFFFKRSGICHLDAWLAVICSFTCPQRDQRNGG